MLEIVLAALVALAPVPKEIREWQRERAMRYATLESFIGNPAYGKTAPNGQPSIGAEEHAALKTIAADTELSGVVFAMMMANGFTFDLSAYHNRGYWHIFDGITEIERYYLLWDCNRCGNAWAVKKR